MRFKEINEEINEVEGLDIIGATLLSTEEAEKLPKGLFRYDSWWWLRSPGTDTWRAAVVVGAGGTVDYEGEFVHNNLGGVRPALIISNLKSSNLKIGDKFIFGDKEFEIISDKLALCQSIIWYTCFRRDYTAKGSNKYRWSDVKKYVDFWFEKAKKQS